MSHCVETMAYVGQQPWHQLGHVLPPNQSIERWAQAAGMDWTIRESPVHFCVDGQNHRHTLFNTYPEQKVLYRSDNQQPLSVVSSRYQVVQPQEVLAFYRDLTESAGYELETAGVLKSGRKFWALARTGQSKALMGNDVVKGYLLLATSCDGTLATVATPTTVRVVCANTLAIAVGGAAQAVKVGHRSQFDAEVVKRQLGIAVSQWDGFMYRMKALAERKVRSREVKRFFEQLFTDEENKNSAQSRFLSQTLTKSDHHPQVSGNLRPGNGNVKNAALKDNDIKLANEKAMNKAISLFNGQGRGAELPAAKDTAWGLLCAVTEFVDHEKQARSPENRLNSAWFGQGASIKRKALEQAWQMVA